MPCGLRGLGRKALVQYALWAQGPPSESLVAFRRCDLSRFCCVLATLVHSHEYLSLFAMPGV